ncbi:MAG: hypothetical protein V1778_00450 [bacterium]
MFIAFFSNEPRTQNTAWGGGVVNDWFVHIVGTGTIGVPLIEICSLFRKEFGLLGVTFSKRCPHAKNLADIRIMQRHGALLAVEEESMQTFCDAGYKPDLTAAKARSMATVIIDCTPKKSGLAHKEQYYEQLVADGTCLRAIAQGSEDGFGPPLASRINNHVLSPENRFIQVVSCNTHFGASVTWALTGGHIEDVVDGDFVYHRRSGDVSQEDGQQNDVSVDPHKDEVFGTHQARDVARVFETCGFSSVPLFSSTSIAPSQLMHVTRCRIVIRGHLSLEQILQRLEDSPLIACTHKRRTGTSFSFGRDHSLNGRILTPAIVSVLTISIRYSGENTIVVLWGFTSQDGNSLRSSIAAMLSAPYPEDWQKKIECLAPYIFQEI